MDHRITAISFTPSAALSAPIRATLRGSKSRRIIEVGGVLRPEDGDLELTLATEGAAIPSCSVSFEVERVEGMPADLPQVLCVLDLAPEAAWTSPAALAQAVHTLSPDEPWAVGWPMARQLARDVASALFGWLP